MLATRFGQKDVANAVTKGLDRKLVKVVAPKDLLFFATKHHFFLGLQFGVCGLQ